MAAAAKKTTQNSLPPIIERVEKSTLRCDQQMTKQAISYSIHQEVKGGPSKKGTDNDSFPQSIKLFNVQLWPNFC